MNEENNVTATESADFKPWGMDLNQFCMMMHLAQFAGFIIPFAGWVLPIVMWTTNKDESDLINQNGKNVTNWIISSFIYILVASLLTIVFIGILILPVIGILSIIFTIKGAMAANKGEAYKYPMTISFIK